jgi:hypothetical protein
MGEPLTAGDFVRQWTRKANRPGALSEDDRLRRYSTEDLAALALPEEQTAFLRIAGLPDDAAPFMTFGSTEFPHELENAWGISADLVPDPGRYVAIGEDGCDNPIVLDREQPGVVALVDREQHTGVYVINTSIARFAACLLAYRDHVDDYGIEPAPVEAVQRLADRLHALDPQAWGQNDLWPAEVAGLMKDALPAD